MKGLLSGTAALLCGALTLGCGASSSAEPESPETSPVASSTETDPGETPTDGETWGDRVDPTDSETASPASDADSATAEEASAEPAPTTTVAVAVLTPIGESAEATDDDMTLEDDQLGKVRLEQDGTTVAITGTFHKLRPGKHGFHIRADNSCSASSKAKHFNPTGVKHGPPSSSERHAGDLGNLHVEADGTASFELETDSFTVVDGHSSINGKALVITHGPDNGKTQPHGRAGKAIACGVITIVSGDAQAAAAEGGAR